MCDAYARGDWAAAAEPLHDDIESDTTTIGLWPEAEVLRGRDAVLRFFADFIGTWDGFAQLWTVRSMSGFGSRQPIRGGEFRRTRPNA